MIYSKIKKNNTDYLDSVTELIKQYNPINLAEGHTGFKCSPLLTELAEKHLRNSLNQYADASGSFKLRDKIAQKIEQLYGKKYDPETEITITSGSTQPIFSTISALVREGDQVVVFEPIAGNYLQAIELNGGEPVYVKMKEPNFSIDWEDVQKVINSKTRMIIINSPHNPTGWVMTELDMIRLQRIITGTKIVILSEETFEHVIFDEEGHQSMASFPKLAEQSIIISSLGETYHVTGWQIGFCAAPREFTKEIREIQQLVIHSVISPLQEAFAEFIDIKEEYMGIGKFYQAKRDFFNSLLDPEKYKPVISKGTFFELIDYSKMSLINDQNFSIRMIIEAGVLGVPLSLFYHEKLKCQMIRFNLAQPDETLEIVANKLNNIKV
ncbi:MAG: aminotransferase class I/II-fold pyridoxal phosphate-dependent enzyme [Bacteroidales bacterium]|nr:aminotransferase class I/II-fold pyridoxal phosphate-dependent enzyme [Bacteroidales bacterium]